jgi:hypothetical protein
MTTNVVGLFESWNEAQRVVQDLMDGGFSRDSISIVANDAEGNYQPGSPLSATFFHSRSTLGWTPYSDES